jgi:hypothetical protein
VKEIYEKEVEMQKSDGTGIEPYSTQKLKEKYL